MNESQMYSHAHSVMERYFDTDITDADSAMDVFLDNGVDPTVAAAIVSDMFTEESNDSD